MAKLNKTQKYAILWLHSQAKTNEQIAEELKVSEKQISSVINITTQTDKSIPVAKSSASPISRSKSLMITETAGKKTKSVAIMTKEASMINDEYKNKVFPNQQKNTDKYIYRPNK